MEKEKIIQSLNNGHVISTPFGDLNKSNSSYFIFNYPFIINFFDVDGAVNYATNNGHHGIKSIDLVSKMNLDTDDSWVEIYRSINSK